MVNEIVFYSNVHLGDLHLSRPYVQWFVDNAPCTISYSHNYDKSIFSDIKKLLIANDNIWQNLSQHGDIFTNEDFTLCAFNTWTYAGGTRIGCNYTALHNIFSKYLSFLQDKDERFKNLKLPNFLIPKINYNLESKYICNIQRWFPKKERKAVFVANNFVESNQAPNHNMNELIAAWANKYNCDFYVSNRIEPLIKLNNVYYNEDIIGKYGFDMTEQSYLSTFCDIIIGRNSGPFTFAQVEENLNKSWITMSYNHIPQDAFNWFNLFPNNGQYFHEQDTSKVTEILDKLCLNY